MTRTFVAGATIPAMPVPGVLVRGGVALSANGHVPSVRSLTRIGELVAAAWPGESHDGASLEEAAPVAVAPAPTAPAPKPNRARRQTPARHPAGVSEVSARHPEAPVAVAEPAAPEAPAARLRTDTMPPPAFVAPAAPEVVAVAVDVPEGGDLEVAVGADAPAANDAAPPTSRRRRAGGGDPSIEAIVRSTLARLAEEVAKVFAAGVVEHTCPGPARARRRADDGDGYDRAVSLLRGPEDVTTRAARRVR